MQGKAYKNEHAWCFFSISYNIYQIISLQDLYFREKTVIGNENCFIFMWIQFVNCKRK